jgi:nucleotidyltransferase/DNA polymerase involved in DNA repair
MTIKEQAIPKIKAPLKALACLRIPNFPWQVEVMRKPELSDRSAIVAGKTMDLAEEVTNAAGGSSGTKTGSRSKAGDSLSARVVLAASPDLADVMPGMPLIEATSRHRGVLVIEADTPLYALVFDEIIENLERLVPDIEAAAPGLAYVGIWGLEGLYGDDAHVVRLLAGAVDGFDLRIGVGDNKWLAYAASLLSRANSGRKVTGEPGKFLDRFPVDSLPVPYQLIKRLHAFGLTTMGHIADIPRGPMEAQFGQAGGTAWELANGIDNRPLMPKRSVLGVSEHLDFPDPTVSMAAIVPAIESLLGRAYGRSQLSRRFARQASLQAQVFQHAPWTMRVPFKDPAGNKNQALFAIKTKLDMAVIPGPLEDMRITLSGITGEAGRQESMWKEVKREEDLQETISQLRTRLRTAPPIYQVRELEPWSRIPERRYALVQLSPNGAVSESSREVG